MALIPESKLDEIEQRKDANDIPMLVSELKRVYGISYESRVGHVKEVVKVLLPQVVSYHSQKENMAHALVAVQIALFAGIMYMNNWPPCWVPQIQLSPKELTIIAFTLMWLIIHAFVRWQLRNRRGASLQYRGLLSVAWKWAEKSPCEQDLKPHEYKQPSCGDKIKKIVDFIIPWPSARTPSYIGDEGYPEGLEKEFENQKKGGALVGFAEIFMCIGSALMFILVLFRTFWGR
jgi:hypothetical protein